MRGAGDRTGNDQGESAEASRLLRVGAPKPGRANPQSQRVFLESREGTEESQSLGHSYLLYYPNTVASTLSFDRAPQAAGLDPSNQRFQGDDPAYSHNEIVCRLNKNRPLSDDRRQACDERRPNDDEQHDQSDPDERARGRGRSHSAVS